MVGRAGQQPNLRSIWGRKTDPHTQFQPNRTQISNVSPFGRFAAGSAGLHAWIRITLLNAKRNIKIEPHAKNQGASHFYLISIRVKFVWLGW